jgi:hypothetical protein
MQDSHARTSHQASRSHLSLSICFEIALVNHLFKGFQYPIPYPMPLPTPLANSYWNTIPGMLYLN